MAESGSKSLPNQSRLSQPRDSAASSLTKKEMARKRSFAEIVDLTQDLSDEENEIRQLRARHQAVHNSKDKVAKPSIVSASGTVSDKVVNSLTVSASCAASKKAAKPSTVSTSGALSNRAGTTSNHPTSKEEKSKSRRKVRGSADRSGLSSSVATEDESSDLSRFKYADSRKDLLMSAIIIRPMNKRSDALRRSTYNPRTIARDVLVSAGKHPTLAPLNQHLDILRRRFFHIDNTSDLGTFRWDLVDPGGQEETRTEPQFIDITDLDNADLGMENGAPTVRYGMQVSTTIDGEEGLPTAGKIIV